MPWGELLLRQSPSTICELLVPRGAHTHPIQSMLGARTNIGWMYLIMVSLPTFAHLNFANIKVQSISISWKDSLSPKESLHTTPAELALPFSCTEVALSSPVSWTPSTSPSRMGNNRQQILATNRQQITHLSQ